MAQSTYGVIFDMDGVLVDSFAAHLESWWQLAAELRQSLTDDQIASTFGRTSRDIIRMLFDVQDDPTIHKLDHRKEELYRGLIRGRVPVMPGAVEFVKDCRAAGMRLAVGSSGPAENVRLVCDEMGVSDHFSALVTGDDITHGKPDPEVFLIAARRLGLESQQCVVIEDAPVGIEAARRARMKNIGLVGAYTGESLASASLVVASLGELNSQRVARLVDG
jgi:beta-phosphoglucomutase